MPRTSTETLIAALHILAAEIYSEDGVANAAIREGAERLEEMAKHSYPHMSRYGRHREET